MVGDSKVSVFACTTLADEISGFATTDKAEAGGVYVAGFCVVDGLGGGSVVGFGLAVGAGVLLCCEVAPMAGFAVAATLCCGAAGFETVVAV